MPDQTTEPRLGAALTFGADAAHCVHVHTGPAGIAAILQKLHTLSEKTDDVVPVIAVLGSSRSELADWDEFDIPAGEVDGLAAMVLALNQPKQEETCA